MSYFGDKNDKVFDLDNWIPTPYHQKQALALSGLFFKINPSKHKNKNFNLIQIYASNFNNLLEMNSIAMLDPQNLNIETSRRFSGFPCELYWKNIFRALVLRLFSASLSIEQENLA